MAEAQIKYVLVVLTLFFLVAVSFLVFSTADGPATKANEITDAIEKGECIDAYNSGSTTFRDTTSVNAWNETCDSLSFSMQSTPVQQSVVAGQSSDGRELSSSTYTFIDNNGASRSLEVILIDEEGWKLDSVSVN